MRLTDPRKPRGKRHPLASLVSVLVAGIAAACAGVLAVAQAAAEWDREVLEAHGCWRSPRTGLPVAPSASTLDRLGRLLDADELEAALSGALAALASLPLDGAVVTIDAMQSNRDNALSCGKRKKRTTCGPSWATSRP